MKNNMTTDNANRNVLETLKTEEQPTRKKEYPFKTTDDCAKWCCENGNPFNTIDELDDWFHQIVEHEIRTENSVICE